MSEHQEHHGDWETQAAHYDHVVDLLEPELSKATDLMLKAVEVRPGIHLLDLACGPGHTTAAAHEAGAVAQGLDASPAMLTIATKRFPGVTFVEGDMRTPPSGPWDAITCRMGGHHADPSWITAAFEVLKPGGRLAIAEPDAPDEEARAKGMLSPKEWIALFQKAGFSAVHAVDSGVDVAGLPQDHLETIQATHACPKGPIYIISGTKPETR